MAFWVAALHGVYKPILTHEDEGITIFQNAARHASKQCHIPQDSNSPPHRCETLIFRTPKPIILVTTVVRT